MSKRTRPTAYGLLDPEAFAEQVVDWLDDYSPLLEALGVLRQVDGEEDSIEALVASRPVARLRLSWELWEALVDGSGFDASDVLSEHLGAEWYSWIRFMVWGDALPQPPALHVVR